MIHKNSTIFKKVKAREYQRVLPIDLTEGDTIRGYNPKTLKYEDVKIMSILKLNVPRILLKLSNSDSILVSNQSFLCSSHAMWCRDDLTHKKQFKLLKKDLSIHGPNTFTPYIVKVEDEHNDIFYDLRTDTECPILVDSYLQYFKSTETGKYGFQIEINGSECVAESLDAKQRTLRVPEESEN